MGDKDLWTTFENTGSVVDYLNYKGIHMDDEQRSMGEGTVESDNNSDRANPVSNTGW